MRNAYVTKTRRRTARVGSFLLAGIAVTFVAGAAVARPSDRCAKEVRERLFAECARTSAASWDPDRFLAMPEWHAIRRGGPRMLLMQWQCQADDTPMQVEAVDCTGKSPAVRLLLQADDAGGSHGVIQGFDAALRRPDGFVDRLTVASYSSRAQRFHVVGVDPATGLVADLLPGGALCMTLDVRDLDRDGRPELLCQAYVTLGVDAVPRVFRFEKGRWIDRAGRYPALLRKAARQYRDTPDYSRDDAITLFREMAATWPEVNLGPEPAPVVRDPGTD